MILADTVAPIYDLPACACDTGGTPTQRQSGPAQGYNETRLELTHTALRFRVCTWAALGTGLLKMAMGSAFLRRTLAEDISSTVKGLWKRGRKASPEVRIRSRRPCLSWRRVHARCVFDVKKVPACRKWKRAHQTLPPPRDDSSKSQPCLSMLPSAAAPRSR